MLRSARIGLLRLACIRLLVQADQVSDDNECAHANESRHADREQDPDKFNLFGVEVKDAHCSSTRQIAFAGCSGSFLGDAIVWHPPRNDIGELEDLAHGQPLFGGSAHHPPRKRAEPHQCADPPVANYDNNATP
jgi:hypothetical protein